MGIINLIKDHFGSFALALLVVIVLGLIGRIMNLKASLEDTKISLSLASNNAKAYEAGLKTWEDRYGQEHAKTIMFSETLLTLKNSQDSTNQQLYSIIKEQGIAIKKLTSASLIETKIQTSLTKEIQTKLPDTVVDLSNKNIKNIITLSPYRITSDIEVYNTQSIFATDSTYKIFIPERKSFFLSRWFQQKQKQTIVNMEVINSNPLIKTTKQKFIHIIK